MDLLVGASDLSVVVIDDDEDHLALLEGAVCDAATSLHREAHVVGYTDPIDALAEISDEMQVVVMLDYQLGASSGLDWIADLLRSGSGPIIMVTSQDDAQLAAEAFRRGVSDFVVKARIIEDPELLARTINEALRRHRLEQRNRELSNSLKVANRELETKNERLAELTDTAHRFVDDVAHEFRTPLAVIREFASIISDGLGGPVTDKQREYLAFVVDASRDLAGLIDDFLDSSKIRAKSIRVTRRPHQIEEALDPVWPLLASRAKLKSITIDPVIVGDLPMVMCDEEKLRRTLLNLAVNAIKFSPAKATVRVRAELEGQHEVRISVEDDGPGLSPDALETLFERFRQAGAPTEGIKGFGLGLSIVRELVAVNLGRIDVKSELGTGSTFSFTVPVAGMQSVVHAFTQGVERRSPRARVAALLATRQGMTSEDLAHQLERICFPLDVVWPDPSGASVILFGETAEADAWVGKLKSWDRARDEEDDAALEVAFAGAWPVRVAHDEIMQLLERSMQGASHA